ncbi:MAG TPA: hypothetical protein VGM03_06715 [Phycisphaerae bacterium]|jgi:hypothetical protein
MTIELSNEEREALLNFLNRELSALQVEVRRTEARDFRRELDTQEHILERLRDRLAGMAAPVSGGGATA